MLLRDIKKYLHHKKEADLSDIFNNIEGDKESIKLALRHLLQKGIIKERTIVDCKKCSSCFLNKCNNIIYVYFD